MIVLNNGETARRAAQECLRLNVHPCDAFVAGVYQGSSETRTEAPETVIKLVLDQWCDILKRLSSAPRSGDRLDTVIRN